MRRHYREDEGVAVGDHEAEERRDDRRLALPHDELVAEGGVVAHRAEEAAEQEAWARVSGLQLSSSQLELLKADLIEHTWMHERYDCAGKMQPNRTNYYFEYPSTVAMLLLYGRLRRGARKRCEYLALFLSFLVFPKASVTVFSAFRYDAIEMGAGANSTQRWLRAGYEIDYDGAAHAWYLGYASVGVLAYPVGIPLVYAALLRSSRVALHARLRAMAARVLARRRAYSASEKGRSLAIMGRPFFSLARSY